jgi:hypothetical protein
MSALLLAPSASAYTGFQRLPPHRDYPVRMLRDVLTEQVAEAQLTNLGDLHAATVETAPVGLPGEWCGQESYTDDTQHAVTPLGVPVIKVVYARASDQPDRFAAWASVLQTNVSLISRYLAYESGNTKTVRFDMGTSCGPQYLDIQSVVLPGPASSYRTNGEPDIDLTTPAIATACVVCNDRNALVFWDGLEPAGHGSWGVSQMARDDSPLASNALNQGGFIANVWGASTLDPTRMSYYAPELFLHEMSHTLGAVQGSAPHATTHGHCTDEADIMCYDDGSGVAMSQVCPAHSGVFGESYDCNHDDYFSPNPAPGSYLATHWNLYNSTFLGPCSELAPACGDGEAPIQQTAPPQNPDPSQTTGVGSDSRSSWLRRLGRRYRKARPIAEVENQVVFYADWTQVVVTEVPLKLPKGSWRVRRCMELARGVKRILTCSNWPLRLGRAKRVQVPDLTQLVRLADGWQTTSATVQVFQRHARKWSGWANSRATSRMALASASN